MSRVAIGSDHNGFEEKKALVEYLLSRGEEVEDVGPSELDPDDDYPDFAARVGRLVSDGACEKGVLICGTGIGMSLAANKFAGVRAAVCNDENAVELSRAHNNANVLCMGGKTIDAPQMVNLTRIFLDTEAEGGRHRRRIEKIARIEREPSGGPCCKG